MRIIEFFLLLIMVFAVGAAETPQAGFLADFDKGVDCYRQKQFSCAADAFSQAAWKAPDDALRARAVFNLANSYFFLGDFEQAVVLFQDAQKLGIPRKQIRVNLAFAESMAASMKRKLRDLREGERRADWRAAARELPDDLNDKMTEGLFVSRSGQQPYGIRTLSAVEIRELLDRAIRRAGGSPVTADDRRRQWIQSEQQAKAGNTMSVFNHLIPAELGIPSAKSQAYRVEGQRPW